MIKRARLSFVVVGACLGLTLVATANESDVVARSLYPSQAWTCPEALLRGCCDTYCPKPQPCISCFCRTCGVDVYCCKPCPCVPIYRACCGPDCFCRKPCPDLCRPLAADYFSCAGWCATCADSCVSPEKMALPTVPPTAAAGPTEGLGISSANSPAAQPR
jgi:hypothetical protein